MSTRRAFMRNGLLFCLGAGGLSAAEASAQVLDGQDGRRWGMIIDLARCNGCHACVAACKARNLTEEGRFATRVLEAETGEYPQARLVFTPVLCNHCQKPPCVSVCPTGATRRNASGVVVTDWARCVGDGACVGACPYGMRFMDRRFGKVDKCDFCLERLAKGLRPACVEACPTGARLFGDLERPEGEFAESLRQGGLLFAKPELGIRTAVLYRPAERS